MRADAAEEAARWAKKRPALIAEKMDEATVDKNILRCLLWDGWSKEQSMKIIELSKQMQGE